MTLFSIGRSVIRQIFGVFMTMSLIAALPAHAQEDGAQDAVSVVNVFHDALLSAMKNAATSSYGERRDMLSGHVDASFDFDFMARFASGAAWKELDDMARSSIAEAFEGFTLANYASRFHGYSGQKFEFLTTVPRRGGRLLVRTQLVKSNGEPVRLDYLLSQKNEEWRIVDVFLDGKFSELALRRSEFAPILRDQGVEGLVGALEDRAHRLSQGDESAG